MNSPSRGTLTPDTLPPDLETAKASQYQTSLSHGRISTKPFLQRSPFIWRPLAIFLVSLPFLSFVWIFFGITLTKPLPLPDYFSPFVHIHSQSTVMVCASAAFFFSTVVLLLFSHALRFAVGIYLAMGLPISLSTLIGVSKISQRLPWIHSPWAIWTWIVFTAFLGISVQTPAMSAFLSVREIQVYHDVIGNDLNLTDSQLLESLSTAFTDINTITEPILNNFLDALQFTRGVSSTFNLGDYSFMSTTGGIQPVSYHITRTNVPEMDITANLEVLSEGRHLSLPFNKSMELLQQGFTADVHCRIENPKDNITYKPVLDIRQIGIGGLTAVTLNLTCPSLTTVASGPVVYNASDISNSGALLGVACNVPEMVASYDVVIRATGAYNRLDFTTCTIIPKTTLVKVIYSNSQQNLLFPAIVNILQPVAGSQATIDGKKAIDMLLYHLVLSQDILKNAVGDIWMDSRGEDKAIATVEDLETSIRAAIEFIGTTIRSSSTQLESPLISSDRWNDSLYAPIRGTFTATTYGWRQDHIVSPLLLVPTTVTILTTYGLLIYGIFLIRDHRNQLNEEEVDFGPTNVVRAIMACTQKSKSLGTVISDQG